MSGNVCSSPALVCEDPALVLRSAPVDVSAPVCSAAPEVLACEAPAAPIASVPAPQARVQATFNPVSSRVSFSAPSGSADVCEAPAEPTPAATGDGGPMCVDGDDGPAVATPNTTPNPLYPNGPTSVSSSGVQQGNNGDCYFLAAVAGQADQHPERIRNMIHDNENGTYTVTFPGRAPITVDAPTAAETREYASANQGTWMPVIEKAYAAVRRRDDLITISGGRENISGGSLGEGITDITGHSTTTRIVSLNSDAGLRNEMRTALNDGRIVTASIRNVAFADERLGLPDGHAYTVTGVDSSGNIMVRNPWGTGGPNNDGRYVFTPDEFGDRFTLVEIEDN